MLLVIMFVMFVEKPFFEQWLCCLRTETLSPCYPVFSNSTGVIVCMYCMLNTHHLHFFGVGNTAVWSVKGKFYFFGAVLLRWLDINPHLFQAFGLLCNVNSIAAKSTWTVWQLLEGGLLLAGEVLGSWDVLQSLL